MYYLRIHSGEVSPDDEEDDNPEEEADQNSKDDGHGQPEVVKLVTILLNEERLRI